MRRAELRVLPASGGRTRASRSGRPIRFGCTPLEDDRPRRGIGSGGGVAALHSSLAARRMRDGRLPRGEARKDAEFNAA